VLFWRVRPAAGALLVPYLAWVSFASVLNYTIWRMNAGG
jgi:translocator protein